MSASALADVLARSVALGAYRGCDAHEGHHGMTYRAVMEWTGPAAIVAVVKAAATAGAIHGPASPDEAVNAEGARAVSGCTIREHCGALDLLDAEDDIVGDWCIPTREAWDWWVRAVELRATSSDCPVDEPEAYAALTDLLGGAR